MAEPHLQGAAGAIFAHHAYLPGGWRENVVLEWNAGGLLTRVAADSPVPRGIEQACGPLLPGMPNLHSHAFQRAMAGLTEYRSAAADNFWSWRELMYRFARHIGTDELAAIAHWLYIEMLKQGYTSVCEFHYLHHAPPGAHAAHGGHPAPMAPCVIEAARRAGIGMTLLPVLYQYSGFGAQPPELTQHRFTHSPDSLLEGLSRLLASHPEHAGLRYGVAPHSLRAVSPASLHALLTGVDRMLPGAPVHIHIAEQRAEVQSCIAELGARPVRWLLDHFEVDARWCLVHATHVDADEVARMARCGATVGLCPTTEANLGDGIFPAAEYLETGGQFGVGSDSHIAVDWRAELRLLEYGQRLMRQQRNVLASRDQPHVAQRLFEGAVTAGARACGRAVGALAPGRRADWMALDREHPAIAVQAPHAWLAGVVFGEHGESPVHDVVVGGRKVIAARRHADQASAWLAYRAALATLQSRP